MKTADFIWAFAVLLLLAAMLSGFVYVEGGGFGVSAFFFVEAAFFMYFPIGIQRARLRSKERKRLEREREAKYASWLCSECDQPFGPELNYVNYGTFETAKRFLKRQGKQYTDQDFWAALNPDGTPFIQHVNLVCPHCSTMNCYNSEGQRLFEKGIPYPPSEEIDKTNSFRHGLRAVSDSGPTLTG